MVIRGGSTKEKDGLVVGARVGLTVGLFVTPDVVGTEVTGGRDGSPVGCSVGNPEGTAIG